MWNGVGKYLNKTILERMVSIIPFLLHLETKIFTKIIDSKGARYDGLPMATGRSRSDLHHCVAAKATLKQARERYKGADYSLA